MDGGGFGDGVRQAGTAWLDACEAGGRDEGAFAGFEVDPCGMEQPEVGFDVVEEAFVLVNISCSAEIKREGIPWSVVGVSGRIWSSKRANNTEETPIAWRGRR